MEEGFGSNMNMNRDLVHKPVATDIRHSHMLNEGLTAGEGRRDSNGTTSLPSCRNLKQNQIIKKVIESSRIVSQSGAGHHQG